MRRRPPSLASSIGTSRKLRRSACYSRRATSTWPATLIRRSSRQSPRTPTSRSRTVPRATVYYLGLNQKNPNLAKPEVRQALKYLVDYSAIADTIMKNKARGPPGLPAEGLPRRHQRQPVQARRRQGQGAARQGRPEGRLHGHDGHPLDCGHHRHRAGDPADLRASRRQARNHPWRRQADPHQVSRPPARHLYRSTGARTIRTRTPTPTPSRRTTTTRTTQRRSRSHGATRGIRAR